MTEPDTLSPSERLVQLPTLKLIAAAALACVVGGAGWGLGATLLSRGSASAWAGPWAATAVWLASVMAILAIRPWKSRPLYRWPLIWMSGSVLRLLATLAAGLLLYSATPGTLSGGSPVDLWLAIVVAYLATLIAETRVYALHMRQFSPADVSTVSRA